jgi:hypothetical protein
MRTSTSRADRAADFLDDCTEKLDDCPDLFDPDPFKVLTDP